MDAPPSSGSTLLVGEGGFSFCVAMVTKWPADKHSGVVATSLESEETILKHSGAKENIQWLKDKGVQVHLSVDATHLHTYSHLCRDKFSRIVFNFPHSGGKSSHKRNRTLLNDFFASAVQMLDSHGQIMVTLCKGQGGTPADRPMRAWQDSWQIVSMAANSGLILVQTSPFCVEDYSSYTSTGFRSLNKAFHTENAITHVFETARPVSIPDDRSAVTVAIQGQHFTCSRYLYEKMHAIRRMEGNRYHPVTRLYHSIRCALSSTFNMEMDMEPDDRMCEPVCSGPIKAAVTKVDGTVTVTAIGCNLEGKSEFVCRQGHEDYASLKYSLQPAENISTETNVETFDKFYVHNSKFKNENEVERNGDKLSLPADSEYHFQYSILDSFRNCLKKHTNSPINVRCMYGPVFRPCAIKTNLMPVQLHMLISFPIIDDSTLMADSGSDEQSIINLEGWKVSEENKLLRTNDVVVNVLKIVIGKQVESQFVGSEAERMLIDETFVNVEEENYKFLKLGSLLSSESDSHLATNVVNKPRTHDVDETKIEIGEFYIVNTRNSNVNTRMAIFVLYLDVVAMLKYAIPDARLLWSEDQRVLEQYINLSSANDSKSSESKQDQATSDYSITPVSEHFTTPSLYPMTFTHDMSFWENDDIPFNEIHYCSIIRNIAGDHVTSVTLIDRYQECEDGKSRMSCCYRLVFQSCDQCLPYMTSWQLQSIVRLEVQKHMKIQLR